jgi:hypothetical protein
MIAMLAGASWSGAALAQDNMAYIGASLFGEQEVGHDGAGEDASGDFSAELDLAKGRMCYMLEVEGLDTFTAAHIHEGAIGKEGPPVVSLQLLGEDGDDVCVAVDAELLKKIARNQSRFYVNVHTEAFPAGAVRGQLAE